MTAKDVLLIPDSRARHAKALGNRLLEQNMRHLATIQRQAMREKKGDIDALINAITRLATSITQVVRLHHQVWKDDTSPEEILTTIHRFLGLDEESIVTEETP